MTEIDENTITINKMFPCREAEMETSVFLVQIEWSISIIRNIARSKKKDSLLYVFLLCKIRSIDTAAKKTLCTSDTSKLLHRLEKSEWNEKRGGQQNHSQ